MTKKSGRAKPLVPKAGFTKTKRRYEHGKTCLCYIYP